ncbi:protein GVQW3-like [Parasteatoda tepidariorum]|uniref:protein GVQW3-like n=1 Tax=Parasteatoda tepidariorum TaxID=114398 RepID=UPI0039BD36DE
MSKAYREAFVSDSNVWKWCRNFDAGRTDVHDAGGHGRKSVSTDDLVQSVDQAIRGNRQFTISELSELIPKLSSPVLLQFRNEAMPHLLCQICPKTHLRRDGSTRGMLQRSSFVNFCDGQTTS